VSKAEKDRLSVCLIIKDEEKVLERCLRSVTAVASEIIIIDTGSSDSSIPIAKSCGASVLERAWPGSFATARNMSLDAATGDWIFVIDADETITKKSVKHLQDHLSNSDRFRRSPVYNVTILSQLEDRTLKQRHHMTRLFRNSPSLRFEGDVHESISLPFGTAPELSRVEIVHDRSHLSPKELGEKRKRNIALLLSCIEDAPQSAQLLHYLGNEYFVIEEHELAAQAYLKSLRLAKDMYDPFQAHVFKKLAMVLFSLGRTGYAEQVVDTGFELHPEYTDLLFLRGVYRHAQGFKALAITDFQAALRLGDAPEVYVSSVNIHSVATEGLRLAEKSGNPG